MKRLRRVLAVVLTLALVLSLFSDSLLATDIFDEPTEQAALGEDVIALEQIPELEFGTTGDYAISTISDTDPVPTFTGSLNGNTQLQDGQTYDFYPGDIIKVTLDYTFKPGEEIPSSFTYNFGGLVPADGVETTGDIVFRYSDPNHVPQTEVIGSYTVNPDGTVTFNITDEEFLKGTGGKTNDRQLTWTFEMTLPEPPSDSGKDHEEDYEIGGSKFGFVYHQSSSELSVNKSMDDILYDPDTGEYYSWTTITLTITGDSVKDIDITDITNGIDIDLDTVTIDGASASFNKSGDQYTLHIDSADAGTVTIRYRAVISDKQLKNKANGNFDGDLNGVDVVYENEFGKDMVPKQETSPNLGTPGISKSATGREGDYIEWEIVVSLGSSITKGLDPDGNGTYFDGKDLAKEMTKLGFSKVTDVPGLNLKNAGVSEELDWNAFEVDYDPYNNTYKLVYHYKTEVAKDADIYKNSANVTWKDHDYGTGDSTYGEDRSGIEKSLVGEPDKSTGRFSWQLNVTLPQLADATDITITDKPGGRDDGLGGYFYQDGVNYKHVVDEESVRVSFPAWGEGWQNLTLEQLKAKLDITVTNSVGDGLSIKFNNIAQIKDLISKAGGNPDSVGEYHEIVITLDTKVVRSTGWNWEDISDLTPDDLEAMFGNHYDYTNKGAVNGKEKEVHYQHDEPDDPDEPEEPDEPDYGDVNKKAVLEDGNINLDEEIEWVITLDINLMDYINGSADLSIHLEDQLPTYNGKRILDYVDGTLKIGFSPDFLDNSIVDWRISQNTDLAKYVYDILGEMFDAEPEYSAENPSVLLINGGLSAADFQRIREYTFTDNQGYNETTFGDAYNGKTIAIEVHYKTKFVGDFDTIRNLVKDGKIEFKNVVKGTINGSDAGQSTGKVQRTVTETLEKRKITDFGPLKEYYEDFVQSRGEYADYEDFENKGHANDSKVFSYFFSLDVNPYKLSLLEPFRAEHPNASYVKLVDTMGTSLTYITGSVKVYNAETGVELKRVYKPAEVGNGTYYVKLDSVNGHDVLTFYIPDETFLRIEYWTLVDVTEDTKGNTEKTVEDGNNEVKLYAGEVGVAQDKTEGDKAHESNAQASADGPKIIVVKTDAETGDPILGSKFNLTAVDVQNDKVVELTDLNKELDLTETPEGTVTVGKYVVRVTETQAPNGYAKGEPRYYILNSFGSDAEIEAEITKWAAIGIKLIRTDGIVEFENAAITVQPTGSLTVTKSVSADKSLSPKADAQFNFKVTLENANGGLGDVKITSGNKMTDTDTKVVVEVTVTADNSFKIENIPEGTTYSIEEIDVPDGFKSNSGNKSTGKIESSALDVTVTWVNTYTVTEKSDVPSLKKLFDGNFDAGEKTYKFKVTVSGDPSDGFSVDGNETTYTVTNNGEVITLRKLNFTKPGTYTVTVTEDSTDVDNSIICDSATITIKYNVVDDGEGNLVATPEITKSIKVDDEDNDTFVNRKRGNGDYGFGIEKTFTGYNGTNSREFKFTLTQTDGKSGVKVIVDTVTATYTVTDGKGSMSYSDDFAMTFTEAGTYTFTVAETETYKDVNYNTPAYTVEITVGNTDNGLEVTGVKVNGTEVEDIYDLGIAFVNEFINNKVSAQFEATKSFSNLTRKPNNEEFSFTLTAENEPAKSTLTSSETKKNDGNGNVTFSEIEFSEKGTYTYIITEEADTTGKFEVNSTKYRVTVKVDYDADGTLVIVSGPTYEILAEDDTVSPAKNGASFVNTYKLGRLTIKKVITDIPEDETPIDRTFSFKVYLTAPEGETLAAKYGIYEVINPADATNSSDPVEYEEDGRSYIIVEITVKDNESAAAVIADLLYGTEYEVVEINVDSDTYEVSYSDNKSGTIGAENDEVTVTVTNHYKQPDEHTPTVTGTDFELKIKKNLTTDDDNIGKTFTFSVTKNGVALDNVTVTANGAPVSVVAYTDYKNVAEDTYVIKEIPGNVAGMTYDSTEYIVVVKITATEDEDGNVTYTKTVTLDGKEYNGAVLEVAFNNTYRAPKTSSAKFTLNVEKQLSGDKTPEDYEYEFVVTENGVEVARDTVTGAGTIEGIFSREYTEAGTYEYVVTEIKGSVTGMTYDTTAYKVTVVVEENVDPVTGDKTYTINEEASYEETVVVTNTYHAPVTTPTSYTLDLIKVLNGTGAPADIDFTVVVEEGDTKSEITVKAGETVNVIDLTVDNDDVTEYVYKIYEKNTGVTGITYDNTYYIVTVNVTKSVAENGDITYSETHTVVHYDAEGNKLADVDGSVVTVTNTYKALDTRANISVIKNLVGRAWNSDDVFTFVLTDANGAEVDRVSVTKDSHTATFKTILFSAAGVYKYTVTEVAGTIDGIVYDTAAHDVTVTVIDNGGELLATVDYNGSSVLEITNTYVPKVETGSLTVTKRVSGNAASTTKRFAFRVSLSDTTVNGTYGGMTFVNGVATVYLAHGESATATGLPVGVGYTVVELDSEDYIVSATGANGTITANGNAVASFINYKELAPQYGGLSVTKTVVGEGADLSQRFTFTVTLSDRTVNGTYGGMTFVNGVATFTLAHGETATASGLPVGITYTVTEEEVENFTSSGTAASGVILSNISAAAAFVNTYEAPATGGLAVTKNVEGEGAEVDRLFTFTVTLSDSEINGAYGDMYFINGVATFQLRHGESALASGLPADISYTVTEDSYEEYIVSATGDSGTITADETAVAAFVNTIVEEETPEDDDSNPGTEEEYNPHDDDANAGVGFDRYGNPIRMDDANPATGNYELEMFYNAMIAVSVVVIISLAALFVLILIKKMRKIGE